MTNVTVGNGKKYTQQQTFALTRLGHLVELRAQAASFSPLQVKMLKRALYSCYLDCLEAGLAAEARETLATREDQAAPLA